MSDSDLTPDQAQEVRRLLAHARHTEPTPDDVVARLDQTLASLSAERAAASHESSNESATAGSTAPVVDLGARRRRRITTGLLGAAAVTVIGLTVPTLLPSGEDSATSSTSADSAGSDGSGPSEGSDGAGSGEADSLDDGQDPEQDDTDSSSGAQSETAPSPPGPTQTPEPPETAQGEGPGPLGRADTGVVRPGTFKQDIARIVATQPRSLQRPAPSSPPEDWCRIRNAWGEGTVLPVRYLVGDDAETQAVVVVRPAASGGPDAESRADLFVCGEDEAVRSTTVPAG